MIKGKKAPKFRKSITGLGTSDSGPLMMKPRKKKVCACIPVKKLFFFVMLVATLLVLGLHFIRFIKTISSNNSWENMTRSVSNNSYTIPTPHD